MHLLQKQEEKKEVKPTFQAPAGLVKELRDKTGAGMMDCKKALGETNGWVWARRFGRGSVGKAAWEKGHHTNTLRTNGTWLPPCHALQHTAYAYHPYMHRLCRLHLPACVPA